jgi:hypothetical protein
MQFWSSLTPMCWKSCSPRGETTVFPTLVLPTKTSGIFIWVFSSVADPNPDPPDPHVFGPPGSGSTCQRYGSWYGSCSGSGSFYHCAKTVRIWLFLTIIFEKWCKWSFKKLSVKKCVKKLVFYCHLEGSMTKIAGTESRIWIRIRIH